MCAAFSPADRPISTTSKSSGEVTSNQVIGATHQTLSQSVYTELRRRIVDHIYQPGDRLVERLIADELGVSRVPVREGLRDLVRDGLVDVAPRRGMFVRSITHDDLIEIAEIRSALDSLLFTRLARRLDPPTINQFDRLFTKTNLAISENRITDAIRLNQEFHSLAEAKAGSQTLQRIMHTVETRMSWMLAQHRDPEAMCTEHRQIFDAMVAQNFALIIELAQSHVQSSIKSAIDLNPELA